MRVKTERMKRLLSMVMALAMILSMLPTAVFAAEAPETLYLKPNGNWTQANARFAAYFFGNGETWVGMTDSDGDGVYEVAVPAGYPNVIFCRMNPSAAANNWNNKWNQTGDLTVPTDGKNLYTVKDGTWDKGGGTWSTYTYVAPTYTIAGTISPAGWSPENGEKLTDEDRDGIFTYTYTNVAAGTYKFKVTNGTWDAAWGGNADSDGNYGVTVEKDGSSVTAIFDAVNKVVSAKVTAPKAVYTVTFDSNGGSAVESQSVEAGQTVQKPADPTRDGFVFVGWYADADLTKAYDFASEVTGDLTLYAKWEEKTEEPTDPTDPAEPTDPQPEETENITVYFRNDWMWSDVCCYVFSASGEVMGTAWPGAAMELFDKDGGYDIYKAVIPANAAGIIFNGIKDDGSGAIDQTPDITTGIEDGAAWYIHWDNGNKVSKFNYTPAGGEGGEGGEEEPTENVAYSATFHFANTLNWGVVNLYTWIGTGTQLSGGWPGSATKLENGYHTATVTFEAPAGQGLNFIFNNGSTQTVDLALSAADFKLEGETYKAEKWVVLTTKTDGKYNAAIANSPEAIVNSPVVDGSSVTFNYGDKNATSVSVAGTFNGWDATATPMTKNADGVWTVTVNDLAAGAYQYKFVVNGKDWVLDPMNSNVVTEADGNQNSAFYILSDENEEDDNTVTIRIHYSRADKNYDGWNLWVWGSAMDGHRVDFDTTGENGAVVATIVLENAREHQYVSFKERLSVDGNEWKEQASSDRSIDLSTVVSGTIDYYIPECKCVYGDNVIRKNKISSVELDYDAGVISITSVQAIPNPESALKLLKGEKEINVTITAVGSKYSLTLPEGMELKLSELYQYQVDYYGSPYSIAIDAAYASDKFAEEFTYEGDDLGATWTSDSTTFRVWAPTATAVSVKLYASGTQGADDLKQSVSMTADVNGTWVATVVGDLNGTYYTYEVTVDGEPVEAVDPYARTTGVNGNRGMVINLDSTDPSGWGSDKNPNPVTSQTDAVIYELHVRDFSIDDSSGMTNKGKYLAFTETGTKVPGTDISTGIDYLDALGITHLHLLPVYDYGSVDETTSNKFNWGYDPKNYNVPEGSYSTDPYNGATRVEEFKQMVKSLHDHDISVVMDVVYNHVYDATTFSFNNIVPGYFSRTDSNTSGCGNDTASEREMVRKYIVESVLYWHQEYHIDGFRFDLVGLLDVQTINEIVETVHACCPDVIFYGEGWDMDGTNREPGTAMAKQGNAFQTPGFAYFSDSMRNGIGGSNGSTTGFASGAGNGGAMVSEWMANPWWTNNPQQVIQYASCHDNYTLADKLILSTGKKQIDDTVIKMNNLSAAFYMTSQGVPFIHAGEEFLREKLYSNGEREENSYNKGDEVNHIEWSNLAKNNYAANSEYYKGLIAFRQAHPALSMDTAAEVKANVFSRDASANLLSFWIDGRNISGETHDSIYVIFNAASSAANVELPAGEWNVCINGEKAGTATLETVSGKVTVAGISAMVLVQEHSTEEPSSNKSDVALPGSFNNWNQGNFMETTDDKNVVVQTISLPAGTYEFKIKNGDAWLGNSGTIVDSTTGSAPDGWDMSANVGDNCKLQASGGAYTFKFNLSTSKLIVEYDPNGGEFGDPTEYYLCGYINGVDYAMGYETGEYKFNEDGKLTVTFTSDSYVLVKNGDSTEKYMTEGYLGAVSEATMHKVSDWTAAGYDKWLIPGGVEVVITMVKNDDNTVTLSYETTGSSAFEDKSGIQKGVTLHAWNWSFDNITANMATIAEQGYTAIQTSPIQPLKEATNGTENTVGSHWWVYYQPVDFVITTDEGNALGTKTDFAEMCAAAEQYGIKVIVDVVANHLANATGNDLSEVIPAEIRNNKDYWHDITTNITNWNDRYNMTQYCMSGLPDLNTANDDIQKMVLDFLKECVDAGADGFRFDAAKSIETPKDDATTFASDFWPTVVDGIQDYAEGELYIYGEILDNPQIAISAYTEYMSVTDNSWGNNLRGSVAAGKADLAAGYHKAADASNLVIWAESHDTYADGSSSGVSEANINKTWALVAARADAMGLYFARPESMEQAIGVASATGWDNPEVEAVNEFHNAFAGESETVGNSGNFSYVVRGNSGIVIVNTSGTNADVELTVPMADGTYVEQITGETFTVSDGKLTGKIGSTGIAVVYGEKAEHSLKSYGKSLLFEDIIRVRYYFEYEGDYTAEYIEKNGGILVWTTEHETFTPGTESYKVEGLTKSNRYYYATGKGIPAKQWGDLQYACAYVKNPDGSITYSEVSPYSPETYAYNMLGKDNTKDSLKDLLVTMLNYGAAAQNNFKYDTENLVNAGLSAEQQAWVWDASKLVTKIEVEGSKVGITKAEGVNYYGWSLVYEGAINMKMYNSIDAALVSNASEMGIIYWNEGTYNSVDQLTPDNIDGSVKEMTQASNYYTAIIEGVAAKDLGDTYFACAYVIDNEGNTHYGEVRSYSAHTYANNTINGNKAEELKNLCKTMVIYSDAAKAHFG